MANPRVFIGSSAESIDYAHAIQSNLEYNANTIVWDQGVFLPSSFPLVDLINTANTVDFAIFVFAPDDVVFLRDKEHFSVRDNVIFEFGLFIGSLGKERVFYVAPRDVPELHLPTDIIGLSPVTYNADRSDNLIAALGSACTQIRTAIKAKGCRV